MSIFKKEKKNQPAMTQEVIEQFNRLVADYKVWKKKQHEFAKVEKDARVINVVDTYSMRTFTLSDHVLSNSIQPLLPLIKSHIESKVNEVHGKIEHLCQTYNIEPPDYDKL